MSTYSSLKVTMISPEAAPFARSGGLADVLGALPPTLERLGLHISLIMPAYRCVLQGDFPIEDTGTRFSVPVSSRQEEGTLLKTTQGKNVAVYLIKADKYFNREYLYGGPDGDYRDNAERFAFFCRSALEVMKLEPPDILHAHDWQSALSIAFLKSQPWRYEPLASVKTLFTIHNLGFQGLFPDSDWHILDMDGRYFNMHYLEFYGKVNFLKSGLVFADAISTVSPSYAEEIKTTEQGFGLEGVLQERSEKISGILNGADYNLWNPETDRLISANYSKSDLRGKRICKSVLQSIFSLSLDPNTPVFGMVTRLAAQKGLDLLQEGLDDLLSRDLQLIILGTGDRQYQELMLQAAVRYPNRLGVKIDFNDELSHNIVSGSDVLLMPSHYEPCGLTQMYGLKYGTVPVVRATGGLKDTVHEFDPKSNTGNGFVFDSYDSKSLIGAIDRALDTYRMKNTWQGLIKNAMACDFSWDKSAQTYIKLYEKLVGVSEPT